MNRNTVEAVTSWYVELIPEIANVLRRNEIAYLVTDDSFCNDAQIWSPRDAKSIIRQFARQSGDPYKTALDRIQSDFNSSREIYLIDRADLAEIRKAVN